MKQLIISLLFFVTVSFAQDELILKDGNVIKGEADMSSIASLSETKVSIRFKPKGWTIFSFYNVDQINFIKASNGKLLYPKGVVGNVESELYHLSNVKHLPNEQFQKAFSNEKEAVTGGYLPCKACFDTHPKISDYGIEKELVKSTILQIHYSSA